MRIYIPDSAVTTMKSFMKYSDFTIVEKPIIYFQRDTLYTNFDAVVFLDGTELLDDTVRNARMHGMPVIGIPRYDKLTQSIIMSKHGINMPDTWFSNHIANCNDIVSLMDTENDSDLFVVKYAQGARGLGQMLLTKREFIDLLDSDYEVIDKVFEAPCKVLNMSSECKMIDMNIEVKPTSECEVVKNTIPVKKTENEIQLEKLENVRVNGHDCLKTAIRNGKDYIIQKYLAHRYEWRMLWFYGEEPIIISRNIDIDNWQANACNNAPGSSKVVNMSELHYYGIDYDKIDKMMKSMNAPFMSIDIYFDNKTSTWGLFEFQMEFGWTNSQGMDSKLLHKRMHNSTKNLLSKQIAESTI